jgi:hypothetical protein
MGAGNTHQNTHAVAIGARAGSYSQGAAAVAFGYKAGEFIQKRNSIVIGAYAGQGSNGPLAADISGTGENSIIINSTGSTLNFVKDNSFCVKNISSNTSGSALYWNSTTGEIHTGSSDDRVKVNEVYIENATDTLLKLKPQNYDKLDYLGSSNVIGHESGLMAQDIWYDAPELRHMVVLGEGAEPTEDKPIASSDDPQDDPDYSAWGSNVSSVNYTQLVPYLIKSIQELKAEIETLKQA